MDPGGPPTVRSSGADLTLAAAGLILSTLRHVPEPQAERVVAELRELGRLTSDEHGAQRLAWTETWRRARAWLRGRIDEIPGVTVEIDPAGNLWATLPGESTEAVVIGSHLDSVNGGGWLDGALGVLAGLEVLRAFAVGPSPARSIRLVDWADEEGARFGRSIVGSSICSGLAAPEDFADLVDRDGRRWSEVLAENGIVLARMSEARAQLAGAGAYLELHIEQGPVLERRGLPLAAVTGTFGSERHRVVFEGARSHSGTTPMGLRQDAFIAAARSAVAFRDDAKARADARATTGIVSVDPGIVTALNGRCEISLDHRALEREALTELVRRAHAASERIAAEEGCTVRWTNIASVAPTRFDPALVDIAVGLVEELSGEPVRLPSGALHDATAVASAVPTAMLFVTSTGGVSHSRLEDSPEDALLLSVQALHRLASTAIAQ